MNDKRMALQLSEGAVEYLAAKGYDPVFGARPVKRALQRELQTLLAKALLRGEYEEDDTARVAWRGWGGGRGPEGREREEGLRVARARGCGGRSAASPCRARASPRGQQLTRITPRGSPALPHRPNNPKN